MSQDNTEQQQQLVRDLLSEVREQGKILSVVTGDQKVISERMDNQERRQEITDKRLLKMEEKAHVQDISMTKITAYVDRKNEEDAKVQGRKRFNYTAIIATIAATTGIAALFMNFL